MDVKHLQKEKWNVTNMKLDVRDGKSEVGNEDFECSHPTSHFPFQNLWHLKKKIELGPEKWEMRIKREFS